MHRVELAVRPDNTGVRRSLEATHCRDEGTATSYAPVEDGWGDYVRYALIESEWMAHRTELLGVAVDGATLGS
jgi:RimJ/RimL family protein N-acetyltransferase